jgi:uracil DNA glycosylase
MVTLWVAVDVVWKEDVAVLVAVLVTVCLTAVIVVWGTPAQEHALRYLSSVPHTALKAAFSKPRLATLGSFEEAESRGT